MTQEQKSVLKQSTQDLIAQIRVIHRQGSGSLSVRDLFARFALTNAPAEIETRDAIVLTRQTEENGRFSNSGRQLRFHVNGLAIDVPNELRGDYQMRDGRLTMCFDPEATISGSKLFIRASLVGLTADESGIEVDVKGPIPLPMSKISFD